MEAIVLAGGLGTRLRQAVADVPKPMAPIGERPFLEILLASLAQRGFSRVVLSLGFMAKTISSHFGNRFKGMDVVYVVEEEPLGTGGALRLALEECKQDHVFVFNGDTFVDFNVQELERHWQINRNLIVVGNHVTDVSRYGKLVVDGLKIIDFVEKGVAGTGLINAGTYVVQRDSLVRFPLNEPFSFEQEYLINEIKSGLVEVFVTEGLFIDIGVPEDYEMAQTLLGKL